MKIGSKLAIYKLKLEHEEGENKIYKSTVIENIQVRTAVGYAWEQHFLNVIIYTTLNLELAEFDKEIPPKEITTKKGDVFTIKQPPYCFERISNPKNSVIRVLDFEFKQSLKRDKKGKILQNTKSKNENFVITQCELDFDGWCLPEKKFEKQIKYYQKQHELRKAKMSELRKELNKTKKELKKFTDLISNKRKRKPKPKKVEEPIKTLSSFMGFEE